MTNDTRTADQIETEIAHERARMTDSINDLQEKFSVESIVRDVGDVFRGSNGEIGGDLRRSIVDTIGRNPTATALTAVGLMWMFLGPVGGSDHRNDRSDRNREASDRNRKYGAFANRSRSDDDYFWRGADNHAANRSSSDEASGGIGGAARSGTGATAGTVSEVADGLRERAHDLKDRLAHGTEDFSAEAKARVIAARQAAHDARISAEATMQRGGRAAASIFEDQPLVVGALALAVGAAIGSVLPHSRIEDDKLGASSDQLFAEAEAIYHEERTKAMAVLTAVAGETKEAVLDAGWDIADLVPDAKTTSDAIVDHVTQAGTRIADTARDEAERQGLGSREV
jgi:hypothetical protein